MGSEAGHCRPTAAVRRIDLSAVDFGDETFRISTGSASPGLVESIRRLGLLVPPLLKSGSGGHVVVSGFRRLEACRLVGLETIEARVLPAQTSDRDCACCAVAENALQRELNPVEAGRALRLLAAFDPEKTIRQQDKTAVGLPENSELEAKLLRVSDLPPAVQAGLLEGAIGLSMALALGGHAPEFGEACARLFSELRVGLNRQRELLMLMDEIAGRDGLKPLEVLQAEGIQRLVDDPSLDRSQKARKIRDWLHQRRYPHLDRAEKAFERHRHRLKLGQNLQLTPPNYFEDDTYTLSLSFKDIAGLDALVRRLQHITAHPSLAQILDRSGADPPADR